MRRTQHSHNGQWYCESGNANCAPFFPGFAIRRPPPPVHRHCFNSKFISHLTGPRRKSSPIRRKRHRTDSNPATQLAEQSRRRIASAASYRYDNLCVFEQRCVITNRLPLCQPHFKPPLVVGFTISHGRRERATCPSDHGLPGGSTWPDSNPQDSGLKVFGSLKLITYFPVSGRGYVLKRT